MRHAHAHARNLHFTKRNTHTKCIGAYPPPHTPTHPFPLCELMVIFALVGKCAERLTHEAEEAAKQAEAEEKALKRAERVKKLAAARSVSVHV